MADANDERSSGDTGGEHAEDDRPTDDREARDGRPGSDRHFDFGLLRLELTGLSADVDELRVGLGTVELGSSTRSESSDHGEWTSDSLGARVGAALGREVGGLLSRFAARLLHALPGSGRFLREDERERESNADDERPARGETDDGTSEDDLVERLERAVGRR